MSLVIPFGQRMTVVDLPNIPLIEGCKSRYHCRLNQVRQIRALTRILTNLQSSCNPGFHGIINLKNELPRYPNSSRGSSGNPIQFWEDIKAWSKTISNLTLKKIKEKKILKTKKGKKLGSDAFQSLLFSFSLIGKSLHAPCSCYAEAASSAHLHQENIKRSDDISPEFLGFVGDMTKKIFGKGWDRKYEETCLLSVVSTNGCFEGGRKEFGALRCGKFSDHYDYVQKVLGEKDFDFQSLCRYSEVCASGKIRPLTITHSSFEVLRPLHKTLYNYISRFPWLLRGPPTPESFAGFANTPGKFVSVDFENATDNLSVLAAERILGTLLARSTRVPKKIKECALESLRPTVVYNKRNYDWDQFMLKFGIPIQGADYMSTLNMGQMMGSLLSFPLLCLQTFFFYLYSTGQTNLSKRELQGFSGCLVNGDDLVFKTENEESFFNAAAETCSVINKKKTHVSSGFFNINSTLFKLRRGGRVKEVPFLRPRQLDIDSCLDSGKKVREATKKLAPGSHLQKKAFSTLMKDAVNLTKKQGWSFKKAGFGGEKQMSWLRARGLLRYEANHYYHVPVESPVPKEESPMQEDCMILDYAKYQVVAPLIEDLSKLYFSWSRFEKFLPSERPKWNGEKEMRKDVIDIKGKEERRLMLKKKSKQLGLNLPRFSSRFPIPINDSIFTSEKKLQKFMANRLTKKVENKNLVASRRMMDILTNNDKSLCLDPIRFHPLLLEVARKKIKKFFRAQWYIRA